MPDDAITQLSASEIAARVRGGELSAVEVVAAHIARIDAVNPRLNAVVIPTFDAALAAAEEADAALRRGDDVGPLHGVPVTIKEQFRVVGTQTTLGASRHVGNVARDEGPLVRGLRDAGAIVLGKTNIIQTLAGWESDNPVYGRTNNPWNAERTPGGSSGGEAAIVAAGGSPLGLAGDLGGSIRVPAHFCGVHGFKPTSTRLTNSDFAPGLLGNGQEVFIPQPGPIARTVPDLRLAMEVLSRSSMHPTADVVPPVPWRDPDEVDVAGLRIGISVDNGQFPVAPAVRRAVEDAAEVLRRTGADIREVRPPDPREGTRLFLRAMSAGGAADLRRLLGDEPPIPQVAGLLKGVRIPAPVRPIVAMMMERRGQGYLADQIRHLQPCSAKDYLELVEARNAYRAEFDRRLGEADALICPPAALPAFTHGSSEHLFAAVAHAFVYNVLGTPAGVVSTTRVRPGEEHATRRGSDAAHVAAAEVEEGSAGLPVGVQVVARHWRDDVVLAVMAVVDDGLRSSPDHLDPPI